MTTMPNIFACAALGLAAGLSPASAQPLWSDDPYGWHAIHQAIYAHENDIAFVEADPEIDDGFKAPIINGARADIARLHAKLPPADWRWASPCCYSRPPLHIR